VRECVCFLHVKSVCDITANKKDLQHPQLPVAMATLLVTGVSKSSIPLMLQFYNTFIAC